MNLTKITQYGYNNQANPKKIYLKFADTGTENVPDTTGTTGV